MAPHEALLYQGLPHSPDPHAVIEVIPPLHGLASAQCRLAAIRWIFPDEGHISPRARRPETFWLRRRYISARRSACSHCGRLTKIMRPPVSRKKTDIVCEGAICLGCH